MSSKGKAPATKAPTKKTSAHFAKKKYSSKKPKPWKAIDLDEVKNATKQMLSLVEKEVRRAALRTKRLEAQRARKEAAKKKARSNYARQKKSNMKFPKHLSPKEMDRLLRKFQQVELTKEEQKIMKGWNWEVPITRASNIEDLVPVEWRARGCKSFQDIEDLQGAEYEKEFQKRKNAAKVRAAKDLSFVSLYANESEEESSDTEGFPTFLSDSDSDSDSDHGEKEEEDSD